MLQGTPTTVLSVRPNPWLEPDLLLELNVKSLGLSMLAENLQIRKVAAHLLHLPGDLLGLGA